MKYKPLIILFSLVVISSCSAANGEQKQPTSQNAKQSVKQVGAKMTERLDQREILPLNQLQRQHVLEEMRGLLVATQGIIEGLANEDMEMVAKSASSAGMKSRQTVENRANMQRLQMGRVLPAEFRKMGRAAHMGMDEISEMAKQGKSAKEIQLKLVDIMNTCVACHSAYQIPNP